MNAAEEILWTNDVPGRRDRVYLVSGDARLTYAEVMSVADGAGLALLEAGLDPGDRVILALRDSVEFVAAFWGALKGGMVPVPVAQGLGPDDLSFIFQDSGARAVVFDVTSAASVRDAARPDELAMFAVGVAGDGDIRFNDAMDRGGSLAVSPTGPDDVALWLYTSGTTGTPKAVMHPHRNIVAATHGLAPQVLGMAADDVILSASRMFFAYGLGNQVYLPASVGASVVVSGSPAVPSFIGETLATEQPTIVFGVPSFFSGFARLPDAEIPASVRAVVSAGEALPAALLERFRKRFGVSLLDGLGATEALHHFTSNRLDDVVPGSAGRPLDGYEVQVRDTEGATLGEGVSGELWVRGPTTFLGYWQRPDVTARTIQEGWMRTGDLAQIRDGRVFHEGRVDDLIKVAGIWIVPTEVEDVLKAHHDVTEAAVVVVDTPSGVPALKAFVVSNRDGGELAGELIRLCRGRLASYKVPQAFEIVEELPRTASGKLRRFVLREREEEGSRS
jgi:benzoate-CoA ligase